MARRYHEIRKVSEPKVEYGSKISELRTECSAKKPEKNNFLIYGNDVMNSMQKTF